MAEDEQRDSRAGALGGRLAGAGRLLFAAAWLAVQAALILTAGRRYDGAFGFRMFSESSTVKYALYREVAGEGGALERRHVDGGEWNARDAAGMIHHFSWYDRVKRPDLGTFDREISASYGAAASIARLEAALEDVSRHVPDDAETRRFVLDVTTKRNGRDVQTTSLTSEAR